MRKLRAQNVETLAQRKKEALDAMELMTETLSRKLEQETSRNGLVIVSALYGKLPKIERDSLQDRINKMFSSELSMDSETDSIPYIDVTIVVQSMVVQSQLHIAGGHTKSNLLGFYDPCYGEDKSLRITYHFKDRLHEVEVDDLSPVSLPLRSHLKDF